MKKGNSIYNPYYSKIQDLLFQGMPMMEVYEYMKIFFNVYADYKTFWRYVKRNKLDWYMPIVGGGEYEHVRKRRGTNLYFCKGMECMKGS
ncbi:MAG: hypothetical protein RR661_06085 [Anaerovoracaceae bacterium]